MVCFAKKIFYIAVVYLAFSALNASSSPTFGLSGIGQIAKSADELTLFAVFYFNRWGKEAKGKKAMRDRMNYPRLRTIYRGMCVYGQPERGEEVDFYEIEAVFLFAN